jgi:hypothetical protein
MQKIISSIAKYTDIDPSLAESLKDFLNQTYVVTRMKIVSEYGHTAVEGIPEKDFLKKFGSVITVIRKDRTKQFIGSLVREIMTREGFDLYSQGAKVRFGSIFSRGSKYCPRDGGQFFSPPEKTKLN